MGHNLSLKTLATSHHSVDGSQFIHLGCISNSLLRDVSFDFEAEIISFFCLIWMGLHFNISTHRKRKMNEGRVGNGKGGKWPKADLLTHV